MIIFYSWQSWTSTNTNRNFILKSLEKAIKDVEADQIFLKLDAVLDRDTLNIAGSPDIADTIFEKIRECDVFIGDVTPVAEDKNKNKIPNPNVLVELGYAASELGWDRIICVLNTAFGNHADLPFDIRGQRLMTYHLLENSSDAERINQRQNLISDLTVALKIIDSRLSPDIEQLNTLIRRPLFPIRIYVPVILWAYQRINKGTEEEDFIYGLLYLLVRRAQNVAEETLPNLLIDKSHALTSRQKHRCRAIARATGEIANLVGYYLTLFDAREKRVEEQGGEPAPALTEYLNEAVSMLRSLYESKWLQLFENLDNKHVLNLDEFLYGKKPSSAEDTAKLHDKLYELMGKQSHSREEFEKVLENLPVAEMAERDKALAYGLVTSAYEEEELIQEVWQFIHKLKGRQSNPSASS